MIPTLKQMKQTKIPITKHKCVLTKVYKKECFFGITSQTICSELNHHISETFFKGKIYQNQNES